MPTFTEKPTKAKAQPVVISDLMADAPLVEATRIAEIQTIFLQQAAMWPGVCGTEMSLSAQRVPGLRMWLCSEPGGVLLECADKKGAERKAFIFGANTIINVLK